MAKDYPLRIDAGATFTRQFRLTNVADGSLFDFTGYVAKAQIRQHPSSTLALELNPTIDIATAIISFTITPTNTSSLSAGPYVWGLEISNATTVDTKRLVEGAVYVTPEVVR
jgi:hypothetical protein